MAEPIRWNAELERVEHAPLPEGAFGAQRVPDDRPEPPRSPHAGGAELGERARAEVERLKADDDARRAAAAEAEKKQAEDDARRAAVAAAAAGKR